MSKDIGASMTVNYTGFRARDGDEPQRLTDLLQRCVQCGHDRSDHYHNRGRCTHGRKRITKCRCTRYMGR
jgi:hypothetical protein